MSSPKRHVFTSLLFILKSRLKRFDVSIYRNLRDISLFILNVHQGDIELPWLWDVNRQQLYVIGYMSLAILSPLLNQEKLSCCQSITLWISSFRYYAMKNITTKIRCMSMPRHARLSLNKQSRRQQIENKVIILLLIFVWFFSRKALIGITFWYFKGPVIICILDTIITIMEISLVTETYLFSLECRFKHNSQLIK